MHTPIVEEIVSRRSFLGLTSLLSLKALAPGCRVAGPSSGATGHAPFKIVVVPETGMWSDPQPLVTLLDDLTKGLVTERCEFRVECRLFQSGGAVLRVVQVESGRQLDREMTDDLSPDSAGAHALYAEALRLAVRLAPDEPYLIRALAEYYLSFRRFDEGIACFEGLMEEHPECPLLPFQAGILSDRGRHKFEAWRAFQRAAVLDPNDPVTLYNLGVISSDLGRPQDAERCFQAALLRDPDLKPARVRLSWLRKKQ